MNNNPFDNDAHQCVVSYQLLQLLRWLFEHEQEALKRVVAHAVKHGLDESLFQPVHAYESDEELQHSIMEFLSLMEALLYEVMREGEFKKVSVTIPAIDNIDAAACDDNLVAMSVAQACTAMQKNPYQDPKELLCKVLLKRWKPSKKLGMN